MEASHRWVWRVLVMAILIGGGTALVRTAGAQDRPTVASTPPVADANPSAGDPAEAQRDTFLGWMVRSSGLFGYLILLLGVVTLGLMYSHLLQLRREAFVPIHLVDEVERLLDDKNYQAAYETARSSDSFLGKVLAAGLARIPRGYEDALQGMQEVGDQEALRLEQSIGYHALIASVAPLLGLLGTVQGLAMGLYFLSGASTSLRSPAFAEGIATALVTTLESLVVALPALISYTLFKNRLTRFVMEAGFLGEEVMKRFRGVRGTVPLSSPRPASTVGLAQQA